MTNEIVENSVTAIDTDTPIIEATKSETNPHSLPNMVTNRVKEAIRLLPQEYLEMDSEELEALASPTPTLYKLKYQFWKEYEAAQDRGGTMSMVQVFNEVCSAEMFYRKVIKNQKVLAWMIRPVVSYKLATEEALQFGIKKLRRILAAPLEDEKGRVDARQAKLVMAIVDFLDRRVMGAVVQKSVNVNIGAGARDRREVEQQLASLSIEELDKKLLNLEADVSHSKKKSDPIPVSATVVDEN